MHEFRYFAYLLEAVAAVAGLYYYRKNPGDKAVGFFAYFLLVTYLVETIGWIPTIIYRWEELHFLKNSFWYKNYWLHNPFLVLTFLVYGYYFKSQLIGKKAHQVVKVALIIYLVINIIFLIFSGTFLESFSVMSYFLGSLLILAIVSYYYLEILQSDKILLIKKEIGFYISFIAIIFYLTCTPIFIYSKYYTYTSPAFVELSTWVLVSMNIFMYSSYSFAFLKLANKKKIYPKNLKNAL